jgi:hypothetical protein
MVQDDEPGLGKEASFTTPEEIAGFLALKYANGMSFKQVLDLHTSILGLKSVCPYSGEEWAHPEWNDDENA